MRLWIDTDIGDDPDDTVALWCAHQSDDAELIGVSTVDGDVVARAEIVRSLLPGTDVVAGPPPPEKLATVDVLVGIGPWTNIATLADAGALPPRVVLMGGVLGRVRHRDQWQHVEHNVGRDPASAARLLATVGELIVLPLNATARLHIRDHDEELLVGTIPFLGQQLRTWRELHGYVPFVLHDPAAVLIGIGENVERIESKRLQVEPDGTLRASITGPVQQVVAHVDVAATRARVRELVKQGD
jgi:inosine-uridine nucleoside N-ribohydrolase